MGSFSALLVQRRQAASTGAANWETLAPCLRLPIVTGVSVAQEIPGGYQEASFTIPTGAARWAADVIQPYTTVWLFDDMETAFYGHIVQTTPNADTGEIMVACDGAYRRLSETRMRAIWSDSDVTQLPTSPGSTQTGQAFVDANGDLLLSFAKGTPSGTGNYLDPGDYIAVDYFLFGEKSGTRDTKKLDGWHISIGSASTFDQNANLEVRIYGMDSPSDSSPVLLQTFAAGGADRVEISDASSGNNTSAWPSTSGYRCFRVGLYANASIAGIGHDRAAKITDFSVTTRGRALGSRTVNPSTPNPISTTDIAKDIWATHGYDTSYLVQEESASGVNAMIVGNITDPGKNAVGMAFDQWSTPTEILDATQAIDGYKVGMWQPTKAPPASSSVTGGSTAINYWPRQPAELVYEPWHDLGSPDYIVRLAAGAQWEPDGQPDTLYTAAYVNYTTRHGRQQSVYVEDTTIENRLYEQGTHVAVDWTVDPAVGSSLASTLGTQFLTGARQPVLSGTLTIPGDRIGSIELPGGARLTKLSRIRPGVIRIVDAPGAKAGRITRVEYTARSGNQPEQVVLSINDPAAAKLDTRLARLTRRDATKRHR